MKKGVVIFVIVIILGAAGFFGGWAQFGLPHGSVGVVRSKTSGVRPELLAEGKITWLWYKLIPGNVKIIPFTLQPVRGQVRLSGDLPQSEVYRKFVGMDADFSWKILVNYEFMIKADTLPGLVESGVVTANDDLEPLVNAAVANIEQEIQTRLNSADVSVRRIFEKGASGLAGEIAEKNPGISVVSINIMPQKLPDFALYDSGAEIYAGFIEKQKQVIDETVLSEAAKRVSNQFRLDNLEQFGALFERYPNLIQYMQFEDTKGN
jgi:hypothetical protein